MTGFRRVDDTCVDFWVKVSKTLLDVVYFNKNIRLTKEKWNNMVLGGRLSLVKEIYLKFEESVEECAEACNDYVLDAGESIKKFWDEITSDLDHQNCAEESHLDVELEYNSSTEMSIENKMTNSNGLLVHVETDFSSSSSKSQNQSVGIPFSPRHDCSQVVIEKLSDNVMDDKVSLIHVDMLVETLTSESQDLCVDHSCKERIDDKHPREDFAEIPVTSDLASSHTCLTKQYCDQIRESDAGESCVPSMKINDVADYSDNYKDFRLSNPNKVFQIAQNDDYEEIEKELYMIPLHKARNKSLKKKLRNVFKWLKGSSQVNHYQDQCSNTGFENEISSVSSGHTSLTSENSIDSGWELL